MRTDENWAIAPGRIREFFLQQADVRDTGDGFSYRSCRITLRPLAGQAMGKWAIPRTQVVFEGDEPDVREIHDRFFLRFLSAGG